MFNTALRVAWAVSLLVGAFGAAHGSADGVLRKIPLVELEVRVLQGEATQAPERVVLKGDSPARLAFASDWVGVGPVRVELTARAEGSGGQGAQSLRLEAVLTLPDGARVRTSRNSVVDKRGTILFELFRQGDRPFTLAIATAISETWEVIRMPAVGKPVRFEIEVLRIEGERTTSLERNILQTFVGQSVKYEFKLGPDLTDDAINLRLTPMRLIDDLVEIQVNFEGRLSGSDDLTVIARDETLVVSRNSSSALTVAAGNPPAGYEFRVTPRY